MRFPWWRRRQDNDLQEEVQAHLAMAVRDRVERGQEPAQAKSAVHREFGNVLLVREITREMWGWTSLERLWQDVRYGVRLLLKSPGFAVVAIATLALGIGANTALFSVVNAVLLRPLPFPDSQQLVTLHMSKPNFETGAIPFPNFRDWQAQNHTFTAMALTRNNSVSLLWPGETEYVRVNYITSDFFRVLGVDPLLGRHFATGEDDLGAAPLAEISESLWQRRFGGAADVVGRTLNVNGKLHTIVGVIPATFDLELVNFAPSDIYLPLGNWGAPALKSRHAALGLHGIGRIKPGITLPQARADMETVSHNLQVAYPDANQGMRANLIPLKPSMVGNTAPLLLTLLGAVGFVLLIACANVASLLLARSQARTREFAVRAALGAGRTRLLRQLLTESLLLALFGDALGLLLAAWGTRFCMAALPHIPRGSSVHIDVRVLLFSLAASIAAGLAFGVAPALSAARPDLVAALQSAGRRVTAEHHRTQRALVVAEVAIALVLLVGAGLMLRTLSRLWSVDPGFDTRHTVMFGVALSPSAANASPAALRATWREVGNAISRTPGVKALSFRDGALPLRSEDDLVFWLAGNPRPRSDSEMNWALRYGVQPDFLRVMGIPLVRGRFFNEQDTPTSPRVVVVDEVLAKTFFPNQDALGRRIRWGADPEVEAQIVGIVRHIKQWGLDSDDTNSLRAELYEDQDQQPDDELGVDRRVILRTAGEPLAVVPALKRNIASLNAENVVFNVITMQQAVEDSLASRRTAMTLLGAFAALALVLATIGLYGVIAYLVGQRTQEFGIRLALGAEPRDVLYMVIREGAALVLAGLAIGALASLALTRTMTTMLYGVRPTDPVTFAAVAGLLCIVALAACIVPARRAMLVDPMAALRYE